MAPGGSIPPTFQTGHPNSWRQLLHRAMACHRNGRLEQAIDGYRTVLTLNSGLAGTHHNLGAALFQAGRADEALASFESALRVESGLADAWFGGGNALCVLGRLPAAVQWYQKALSLRPVFAEAHYNLANAFKALDRLADAVRHYELAIDQQPEMAEAHNNLGSTLYRLADYERALAGFQRAVDLRAHYPQAHYNMALVLKRQGCTAKALKHVKTALAQAPDHAEALSLLVPLLQQVCDWPALETAQRRLEQLTDRQLKSGQCPVQTPFLSFSTASDPERNRAVATAWSQRLTVRTRQLCPVFTHPGRADPGRPIIIGYLSEQFRNAATAHLMVDLLERHDRRRFRIMAYSLGADDRSTYRQRIIKAVDGFVNIRQWSVADAARRIYRDRVDILVDLMGWMHGHRMEIAALKPAPVQVNYLGYPGTTGADFMDYIIADPVVIPPEHRRFYSEQTVYLPHTYQPTDPAPEVASFPASRAECQLPADAVVLCSFNTDYKIEPVMFETWMNILAAVPDTVLWLLIRAESGRRRRRESAAARGIEPDRLVFAPPLPKANHLARLQLADLALDTRIVNGHTTTSDALWSGVPVITLQGRHFASRVASSLLQAAGLVEMVTHQLSDYQNLAIDLAGHPSRLALLRRQLLQRRRTCPLFDSRRLAYDLEVAYETMYRRYAQGLRPRGFVVSGEDRDLK